MRHYRKSEKPAGGLASLGAAMGVGPRRVCRFGEQTTWPLYHH